MKSNNIYVLFVILLALFISCKEDISKSPINTVDPSPINPNPINLEIRPVNIEENGFDFLEKIQGHWIGINRVITDDFPWFALDYRAISSSHIHGMFEGGSMGDLYCSFFVADFKNTKTIMARNGGILNGIYRASYFVLDSVRSEGDDHYYRLVDAHGGIGLMSMELRFKGDSLYFNAYTSRLGMAVPPTRHMTFKARKGNTTLASEAAAINLFPQRNIEWDFSEGFDENKLWVNDGDTKPRSATFLDYSKDPFKIEDHKYLAYLTINIERNNEIDGKDVFLFLSSESLTDANGYLLIEPLNNSVLKFPTLTNNETTFDFDYTHPGTYYVTAIADVDNDGDITNGDITNISKKIVIEPESQLTVTINGISVKN